MHVAAEQEGCRRQLDTARHVGSRSEMMRLDEVPRPCMNDRYPSAGNGWHYCDEDSEHSLTASVSKMPTAVLTVCFLCVNSTVNASAEEAGGRPTGPQQA